MKKTVKKKYLGKIFSYTTEVDSNGKSLWTEAIDIRFTRWLHELKLKNRELFKVQYSLTNNTYETLLTLKDKLGVYDDSLIVRAMTIIFINEVDTKKRKNILELLINDKNLQLYHHLQEGEILKKNLYFSPIGMRDLEAYSNLTGSKKSQIVKNAVHTILMIYLNENRIIKKFWEDIIVEQLSTILKAA